MSHDPISFNNALSLRLCEILGVDPHNVARITIDCLPREAPRAIVELRLRQSMVTAVANAIEEHKPEVVSDGRRRIW